MHRSSLITAAQLGIYWRRLSARLYRGVVSGLEPRGGKRLLLGLSLGMAVGGIAFSWFSLLAIGLLVAATLVVAYVKDRAFQKARLRAAIRRHRDFSELEPADQVLVKMGIDEQRICDLLRRAGIEAELRLAELDQNNRVLSDVGPIPLFETALIDREAFRKRSRNKVEIVIISNVVALKKRYRDFSSFRNEVIALDALEHLDGVPKIVALDERRQTLCQSFVPGFNLGTLMVAKGASVSFQYQLGRKYPGIDNWSKTSPTEPERALVLDAQSQIADDSFIGALQSLFVAVHAAGVALRDLKHGNVITYGGDPHFCDFDLARVYPDNNIEFIVVRERERDKFNYLFDGDLPTSSSLLGELGRLKSSKSGSALPSVYFGGGYSLGNLTDANNATALWLSMRRKIVGSVGGSVIDLGSKAGVIALELLRSGVRRVRSYEPDIQSVLFAQLSHQFFELVDNRAYDFQCVPLHRSHVVVHETATYDTALALDGLSGRREELQQLLAWLSENVRSLIIGCPDEVGPRDGALTTVTSDFVREFFRESKFARFQQFTIPGGSLTVAAAAEPGPD